MSVEIKIRQKGLLKKKLDIKDIVFEHMSYGIMDEYYRLVEKEVGTYTIVYDTNYLGRGFEVCLEKGIVNLRMNFPISNHETRFFYSYIKRICELLHTNVFEREGIIESINDISQFIEQDIKTSENALKQMKDDIESEKMSTTYLFGVLHPIALGEKELSVIENDTEKLGTLFHELQSIDAYYAVVKAYQKEDKSLFGMYVLTENVLSIFPFKPGILMDNKLKIEHFYVSFVYNDEIKGCISYEDFMASVDITKSYDSEHFLILLDKQNMKTLLEKYRVEL